MKRILFVDDELCVLEGLKRMLRPRRREWDMAFANSGEEALAILASAPHDVIVTDMRMPVMDGAQLLKLVRERYPAVVRIVLSGQFEMDAALRAAPVAHQFLSKPCDLEKLRSAIDRACGSSELLADEEIRRIIGAVGALPTLPSTSAALLAALQDTDVRLDQIGGIIERDVGMTAKILQLVNSAFFGWSTEITTVNGAVGYLGLDVLRQLVLSVEVFRTFRPVRPIVGFSLQEFELHSCVAANMASRLPASESVTSASVVAALLHDTGTLVLASRLPAKLERITRAAAARSCAAHAVEQEIMGTTHAEIGAYLLNLWGLPKDIVDAVYWHHRPLEAPGGSRQLDTLAVTHIADAMIFDVTREAADHEPAPFSLLDEEYLKQLGVAGKIEEWRALARQALQERAGS